MDNNEPTPDAPVLKETPEGETTDQGTTTASEPEPEASKAELYDKAKDLDVEGRSTMDKQALAEAVAEAEAEAEPDQDAEPLPEAEAEPPAFSERFPTIQGWFDRVQKRAQFMGRPIPELTEEFKEAYRAQLDPCEAADNLGLENH